MPNRKTATCASIITLFMFFNLTVRYTSDAAESITKTDSADGYARPIAGVRLSPGNNDLKVGPGMNAVGRNLQGCRFEMVDLSKANFENCNLDGVEIDDCKLTNASFRKATLTGFRFYSGDITDANFTDAIINGRQRQTTPLFNLSMTVQQFVTTASYKKKTLRNCVIPGSPHPKAKNPRYDFREAELSGAIFRWGNFSECDFAGAKINYTNFASCIIEFNTLKQSQPFVDKRLAGTGLSSARVFGDCDFSGMNLTHVSFSAQYSDSVNLTGATLEDCYLLYIDTKHLTSTKSFEQGELSGLRFEKCDFAGCDFSGRDLAGTSFKECEFTQARFTDAVISRVQFANPPSEGESNNYASRGLTADQIRSTWNYKHGRMKGIVLPAAVQTALDEQ